MLKNKLRLAGKMLLLATGLTAIGTGISGCASSPQPVLKPCGVIKDSLKDVKAVTREGNYRIDMHYEGGRKAGCWK